MANHGVYFAQCKQVDPLLLMAINYHESHFCRDYPDFINDARHNCGGYMNGGQANGLKQFATFADFINAQCALLSRYITSGKNTIQLISATYAPTTASPVNFSWTGVVSAKYKALWEEFTAYKKSS